jgi:hypothetical protein
MEPYSEQPLSPEEHKECYEFAKKNQYLNLLTKIDPRTHSIEPLRIFDDNKHFIGYGSPIFLYMNLLTNIAYLMLFMSILAIPKI